MSYDRGTGKKDSHSIRFGSPADCHTLIRRRSFFFAGMRYLAAGQLITNPPTSVRPGRGTPGVSW